LIYAGIDLISGVTCQAPYEWVEKTGDEWEFNTKGRQGESFNVCILIQSLFYSDLLVCLYW